MTVLDFLALGSSLSVRGFSHFVPSEQAFVRGYVSLLANIAAHLAEARYGELDALRAGVDAYLADCGDEAKLEARRDETRRGYGPPLPSEPRPEALLPDFWPAFWERAEEVEDAVDPRPHGQKRILAVPIGGRTIALGHRSSPATRGQLDPK